MKISIERARSNIFTNTRPQLDVFGIIYTVLFVCSIVFKGVFLQFQNQINFKPLFSTTNIFMFVASMSFTLVLAALLTVFHTKRRVLFFISNILMSVLLLSDALYLRYYNTIITIPVIYNARYLGPVRESIMSLFRFSDIFYFLDIPVFAVMSFIFSKRAEQNKLPLLKRCVVAAVLMVVAFGSFKIAYSKNDMSEYDNNYIVKNFGIGYFHYYDVKKYLKENYLRDKKLRTEEKNELTSFFEEKNKEKAALSNRFKGIAKGKNLIIVQMEALQHFVINSKMNGREITPNLNKLVKESLYFDNIYVQVAGGNTSDAEFMTNTSLYPAKEGAAYFRFATNEYNTIPKELKKEGYNSYALHAYGPAFWNRTEMYKAIGFDTFISSNDYVMDEYIGWGGWALSDDSFFRQSLEKIDVTKPFYSFFITLSGHHPYSYFEDKQTFDVGKYDRTYFGNYIKAQNYADAALGRFIERLKEMGLYENSLIVIYGDHTGLPKTQAKELLEFLGVDDNKVDWIKLQKIPLLIHCPGVKGETISTTGGQVDIFPMIANMMGFENYYALGKDLLNTEKGYAVLRNGSVLTDDYYYCSEDDTVYDLRSGEVLDKKDYEDEIQKYQKELQISDIILEKDALRKLK
ncbi:MAG TPA: LTA synthase family protein [Hungateiclostridium thermocellum]|mgnify:FL=1|jgi:lipoteichoic acid synthase|uniref:Sulfatase n=2 Tax=Acetivibrio thermocellus TaxID=1515 RepID=A3DBT6_ACET2|nr:LTA synthase family protein [Acetivibrio thermocellus]CDG34853.1 sulfatase [Acetivibrio thermocellus BC1]ABN51415.1 sulfatase [Acetivibrio thermocellus ATCC 27405]ADU75100.1 sulfatase [Acetivibrio thermocellus DSM 1313]ALX09077.1 sulfatase [Acetivibrio thermocellus AD2]ANV76828.1 sulfatase [Acetivibrio thermocellus DSM 2360]